MDRYYREHAAEIERMALGFYAGAREMIAIGHDATLAERIQRTAQARFQQILPGLPDIGGELNPLIATYLGAAVALGFCLAAREHGLPVEETGRAIYQILEAHYNSDEGIRSLARATRQSIEEQRLRLRTTGGVARWPDGWRAELVEPVEPPFDIGWDNRECGILKLFIKHDARAYVPYLCMVDAITYPLRGLGLVRTRTLVESDRCDFRVGLGGATQLEAFAQQRLAAWRETGTRRG